MYSFDPAGLELRWDERVICQTSRGREYGRVVQTAYHLPDEELTGPLKRVVRRAGAGGRRPGAAQPSSTPSAACCSSASCPAGTSSTLKPIAAELVFDQSRIVFSFSSRRAAGHARAAVRPAAPGSKRRVELRQVGPREQGRLCGEVGLCGTGRLCSARYPCHDQPITLKMAKEQDLPMNPGRITGLCGRLRCCLAFEHPLYRSFRDRAPAVGRAVATPNGRGVVRSYEVLKDACVVELDGRTMVEITLDQMVEVAG